eukprot:748294-Rhodomonas_salina.1
MRGPVLSSCTALPGTGDGRSVIPMVRWEQDDARIISIIINHEVRHDASGDSRAPSDSDKVRNHNTGERPGRSGGKRDAVVRRSAPLTQRLSAILSPSLSLPLSLTVTSSLPPSPSLSPSP